MAIKLSRPEVTAIKQRIWNGETREQLADDFNVSLGQVCNIGAGHKWPDVPWPDGSFGALPQKRKEAIEKARKEARGETARAVRVRLNAGKK